MFVPSCKNSNDDSKRYFNKYYMPLSHFFDQTIKKKQEAYGKPIEISRNNDFTTEKIKTIISLLFISLLFCQNYYQLIDVDLSRQTNTSIHQKINFPGKLEGNAVTMFFIAEK